MADPAVIAFILVGIVGGVAVVMSVSADWELTHDLSRATGRWSAPVIVRRYDHDDAGRHRLARETAILEAHGYHAAAPGPPIETEPGRRMVVTFVLVGPV